MSAGLHALFAASVLLSGTSFSKTDAIVTISYVSSALEKPRLEKSRKTEPVMQQAADAESLRQNPKTALVFENYFSSVKEKIHTTIRRKFLQKRGGPGNVAFFFVINAQGQLEQFSLSHLDPRGSEALRYFALECLKNSAPFKPFPKELAVQRISFRLQAHFGE